MSLSSSLNKTSKRVREAVYAAYQTVIVEMAIRGFSEKLEVRFSEKFDTAAWLHDGTQHVLLLGGGILGRLQSYTPKRAGAYMTSYLRHEFGHAFYTERDLQKTKKKLNEGFLDEEGNTVRVPFGLWNLFEDARIEHLLRGFYKKPVLFQWDEFEDGKAVIDGPSSAFFRWIQSEGVGLKPDGQVDPSGYMEKVKPYYEKTLEAKDFDEMFVLMVKFLMEFRKEDKEHSGFNDLQTGTLTASDISQILSSSVTMLEFVEHGYSDAAAIPKEASDSAEIRSTDGVVQSSCPLVVSGGSKDILAMMVKSSVSGFVKEGAELAVILKKIMVGVSRYSSVEAPQKRIDKRSLISEKLRYRKKTDRKRGRSRVEIILDLSGSMSGYPSAGARSFVKALSILAAEGNIEGGVTLSAGSNGVAFWQRLQLPVPDEAIKKIEGFGCFEGLANAISNVEKHLKSADIRLVYTDGAITDRPLDKAAMRTKGIPMAGMYVGDLTCTKNMEKYFQVVVARKTPREVAIAIAQRYFG